ncbi:putative L-carnitine dehydratase [Cunninghamella echinulata]|nr:putative L-carnitine dehydratase [Cunninghamella echinulata]
MNKYNLQEECMNLFHSSIINNDKVTYSSDLKQLASTKLRFEGSQQPGIPINWRFAESISVLKAFEGLSILDLVQKKYNTTIDNITINTDHAQLFIMTTFTNELVVTSPTINIENKNSNKPEQVEEKEEHFGLPNPAYHRLYNQLFKNQDFFKKHLPYNFCSCAIYKTKDDKLYHLYGSFQPQIIQKALDMRLADYDESLTKLSFDQATSLYQEKCLQYTAEELDTLSNDQHGEAGSICFSTEEFKQTEQYKATQHVDLFETHFIDDGTPAQWWIDDDNANADVKRPLKGLKVLDITRVIAAPVVTRTLAEYGASVLRITSPKLPDVSGVLADTNYGKWNTELDFHDEKDRKKLLSLMQEADVIVEGYRPYHLDKYGLGKENILKMAKERGKGVIYVRENTYGWYGPWQGRIGWQPISDACCGVSTKFAEALALATVSLVFPNSDYCTGTAGATAVIQALIDRSTKGGSYVIDSAINYYSMWLVDQVGTYDNDLWLELWKQKGKPELRYFHNMIGSVAQYSALLKQHSPQLWNPDFFEKRDILNGDQHNVKLYTIKPVVRFSNDQVTPGFDIPTRTNGTDAPLWPKDLNTKQINA